MKIRVGVLFGGRSVEHEVSLLSAKNVIRALDPNKYEILLIGIDKEGKWQSCDSKKYLNNPDDPKQISLADGLERLSMESCQLISLETKQGKCPVDIIFPILHGTYGEDGTIQGLLKLADVPFVGAGVLGSAVGMDKEVAKRLLRDAHIPIAKFICVHRHEWGRHTYEKVVESLGSPLFVKPSVGGSSIGITKVKSKETFEEALKHAFQYDRKLIIEEAVNGREIECAVIGNEYPIVSVAGEVFHRDEFYTYDAKYIDSEGTRVEIPAKITPEELGEVQRLSLETYRALNCEGMARVDSFLTPSGKVIINEINTLPGCTSMSPFPHLWEATGIGFRELVDRLIHLAIDRYEKEKALKTDYEISHTNHSMTL